MTPGQTTFGRYVLTGALTAVSYLALSLLLQRALGIAVLASFLAYATVVVLHFALNNFYTFRKRGIERTTVSRYSAVIAAFAVLNLVVDQLVRALGLPVYVLYLTNMVLSPLLSFVVMKSYVFGPRA